MSPAHVHTEGGRAFVVELLGLPGSGKTTVAAALLRSDPRIVARPVLRGPRYATVLAVELAAATASLVRRRALRGRTPEHLRTMAYLQGLPRVLAGPEFAGRVVVFDQGPVYFLARPAFRDDRLSTWRARMLATWRGHLGLVAWLDAPVEVLRERIETRAQEHRIKGHEAEAAVDFLAATRAAYEDELAALTGEAGGPSVLRLDTSRLSVDETVARVLEAVDAVRSSPAPHATALASR